MCENGYFSAIVQVQLSSLPLKTLCFFVVFLAGQEKLKPKKSIDLFDEDGDIFTEKYSAPAQSKEEVVVEQIKHPEKKVKINMHVWVNMMALSINGCMNYIFCLVYVHSVYCGL